MLQQPLTVSAWHIPNIPFDTTSTCQLILHSLKLHGSGRTYFKGNWNRSSEVRKGQGFKCGGDGNTLLTARVIVYKKLQRHAALSYKQTAIER